MKKQYKICIVITVLLLNFILIGFFVPGTFLIFHLDKYESNQACEDLDGHWNWFDDVCIVIGQDITGKSTECWYEDGNGIMKRCEK